VYKGWKSVAQSPGEKEVAEISGEEEEEEEGEGDGMDDV
jgi:hypothetical protein